MKIYLFSILTVAMIGVIAPSAFAGGFTNEDLRFSIEFPDHLNVNLVPAETDDDAPFLEIFGSIDGYTDFYAAIFYWGTDVSYSDKSDEKKLDAIIDAEKELVASFECNEAPTCKIVNILKDDIIKSDDMTIFEIEWLETEPFVTSNGEYWDRNQRVRMQEIHTDDGVWGLYFYGGDKTDYNSIVNSFTPLEHPNPPTTSGGITSAKIIQGEPYSLLVVEVQLNEGEWAHGPSLGGMESGFIINERDTKIFTDDFSFLGTTIPKNNLWDENCPIYVLKKAYLDMPIYFTMCFEIPKSESNFILTHTSPTWQGKFEFSVESQSSVSVPTWIKNNAGWWAEGQIDDNSFVQGIQFMIKENIISIPNLPESSSETADSVPAWIKNNAGWWAEGQIDDNSFVQGIEYLVKVGIIQVT